MYGLKLWHLYFFQPKQELIVCQLLYCSVYIFVEITGHLFPPSLKIVRNTLGSTDASFGMSYPCHTDVILIVSCYYFFRNCLYPMLYPYPCLCFQKIHILICCWPYNSTLPPINTYPLRAWGGTIPPTRTSCRHMYFLDILLSYVHMI